MLPSTAKAAPSRARAQVPTDPGDIRGARRLVGLLRVGIDASAVEGHLKQAALEGRLIVTVAKRAATAFPGAAYRLLASDAGAQFAELLAVIASDGFRCPRMASDCL